MNTETPDYPRDLLLHDIRTPLATVSGYAPLLRRRAAKRRPHLRDLVRYLDYIEAAGQRAEQVLNAGVNRIIAEYGGTISVEGEREVGAAVTARLPVD